MAVYAIHYCDSSRIVQSLDLYVCEFLVVAFHGSDIESCRMSYNDWISDSRVGIHGHFAIYDGPKNIMCGCLCVCHTGLFYILFCRIVGESFEQLCNKCSIINNI